MRRSRPLAAVDHVLRARTPGSRSGARTWPCPWRTARAAAGSRARSSRPGRPPRARAIASSSAERDAVQAAHRGAGSGRGRRAPTKPVARMSSSVTSPAPGDQCSLCQVVTTSVASSRRSSHGRSGITSRLPRRRRSARAIGRRHEARSPARSPAADRGCRTCPRRRAGPISRSARRSGVPSCARGAQVRRRDDPAAAVVRRARAHGAAAGGRARRGRRCAAGRRRRRAPGRATARAAGSPPSA